MNTTTTPRTDAEEERLKWPTFYFGFARQLETELEESRNRAVGIILERDRWRAKAEEKIALRREIEAALNIQTGDTNDEALAKGIAAIRALQTELADTQAQLAEANRLTLRAEASVENYASAAEELRREVNELRAELARIQGQTRWECTCGGTDCEGRKENEEQARLLELSATREARLRADLANCQRDVHELLRLLGEIRMATGDRNKRNQADLVAYCADLAKRAALLEKVRAYPYIPSGLAALIERELAPDNPEDDLDRIFSPSA